MFNDDSPQGRRSAIATDLTPMADVTRHGSTLAVINTAREANVTYSKQCLRSSYY